MSHTVNEPLIIKNGKICDIGCGNGEYILESRRFGWEVYGVEPNKKAVDLCLINNLKVKLGDAEAIPYDDKSFDVVRMWNVLEHTISPKNALLAMNRILKHNGFFIFYIPNFRSLDSRIYEKYWSNLEVSRHTHHFNQKSIKLYLEKTGFCIEKCLYPGILKSIKVLKQNQINILRIIYLSAKLLICKIFCRFVKRTLTYEPCSHSNL